MELYVGTSEKTGSTVSLPPDVRRKHAAIFGKSGVGKTTLLRNMVIADIQAGIGVTVIDPHGSLVDDLLRAVPRQRTNDVIYLNPAEPSSVPGINVLESVARRDRSLVVSALISILRNLYPNNWGPRTEYILEHAVYALLEQPEPPTLAALPKLLVRDDYRRRIVANVTDPAVRAFFDFYENQNDRLRDESIAPLLNKVSKFISNPLLRDVVGQPRSSFDFRWAMDNSKIILCKLSKSALGDDVSSLLGSLIVTKLSLASSPARTPRRTSALSMFSTRTRFRFHPRRRLPYYIERVQKIRPLPYHRDADPLPVARSIPRGCVRQLRHDHFLPGERRGRQGDRPRIRRERRGAEDGRAVVRRHRAGLRAPEPRRLQALPPHASGRPAPRPPAHPGVPPFPKLGNESRPEVVVKTSLARYGRDRAEVEARLTKFLSRN